MPNDSLQLHIPVKGGGTFTVTLDPERIVALYRTLKSTADSPLEAVFVLAMTMRIIRADAMQDVPMEAFTRVITEMLSVEVEDLPAKGHQH